jgi:hypothetical protein
MKYEGNKLKDNSLRPWVLIPEDNRHSTVTRKIPLFSVEPVTISYTWQESVSKQVILSYVTNSLYFLSIFH